MNIEFKKNNRSLILKDSITDKSITVYVKKFSNDNLCINEKKMTLSEFENKVKSGATFGFEKKELQEFLLQNTRALSEARSQSKQAQRDKTCVWINEHHLNEAKRNNDYARVVELEAIIARKLSNY